MTFSSSKRAGNCSAYPHYLCCEKQLGIIEIIVQECLEESETRILDSPKYSRTILFITLGCFAQSNQSSEQCPAFLQEAEHKSNWLKRCIKISQLIASSEHKISLSTMRWGEINEGELLIPPSTLEIRHHSIVVSNKQLCDAHSHLTNG